MDVISETLYLSPVPRDRRDARSENNLELQQRAPRQEHGRSPWRSGKRQRARSDAWRSKSPWWCLWWLPDTLCTSTPTMRQPSSADLVGARPADRAPMYFDRLTPRFLLGQYLDVVPKLTMLQTARRSSSNRSPSATPEANSNRFSFQPRMALLYHAEDVSSGFAPDERMEPLLSAPAPAPPSAGQ